MGWITVAFVTAALVAGGLVKGVLGFGLRPLAAGLLALHPPAGSSIGMLLVPCVIADLRLVFDGRSLRRAVSGRDKLVQAVALLSLASVLATAALRGPAMAPDGATAAQSFLFALPVLAGLLLGRAVRRELDEGLFSRWFFAGAVVFGTCMLGAEAGSSFRGTLRLAQQVEIGLVGARILVERP